MLWGSVGGLSILKLILSQSKAAATHDTSLIDSKFKNAIPETEPLCNPPAQYSIYYMNHGKEVYMENIYTSRRIYIYITCYYLTYRPKCRRKPLNGKHYPFSYKRDDMISKSSISVQGSENIQRMYNSWQRLYFRMCPKGKETQI